MPEQVHVHPPQELEEGGETTSRSERVLEFGAALLLAAATILVAWSGYQAAKWSGVQSRRYTQANTARSLANRAETMASQERLQDLLNFNRWLEVTTDGNQQLADLYLRRFRPEFRPAFEAWIAQDPLHNKQAVPSPLLMKQYRLADQVKSDHLEVDADLRFGQGKDATENTDDYVFTTVFFAAVMFFAGMSLRFRWSALRIGILVLAALLFVYGIVRLATLPTL